MAGVQISIKLLDIYVSFFFHKYVDFPDTQQSVRTFSAKFPKFFNRDTLNQNQKFRGTSTSFFLWVSSFSLKRKFDTVFMTVTYSWRDTIRGSLVQLDRITEESSAQYTSIPINETNLFRTQKTCIQRTLFIRKIF